MEFSHITKVVADSDFDGLCAAAALKIAIPTIEVHFSHPALLRSGAMDHLIDRNCAIVDLPFHPDCGWYLDHHLTNKPDTEGENQFRESGGLFSWELTPSAARLAYDLISQTHDLSHLEEILPVVDRLDSGKISIEEFLADGPLVRLSRCFGMKNIDFMNHVLELIISGNTISEICEDDWVSKVLKDAHQSRKNEISLVKENTEISDRLAICRLDGTGIRTNGYLVTAYAGARADAVCITHGYIDGDVKNPERSALSASFYANSFLPDGQNKWNLSLLATRLDSTGGGHANACGCRIQPISENGDLEFRELNDSDLGRNLEIWKEMWRGRETFLSM